MIASIKNNNMAALSSVFFTQLLMLGSPVAVGDVIIKKASQILWSRLAFAVMGWGQNCVLLTDMKTLLTMCSFFLFPEASRFHCFSHYSPPPQLFISLGAGHCHQLPEVSDGHGCRHAPRTDQHPTPLQVSAMAGCVTVLKKNDSNDKEAVFHLCTRGRGAWTVYNQLWPRWGGVGGGGHNTVTCSCKMCPTVCFSWHQG